MRPLSKFIKYKIVINLVIIFLFWLYVYTDMAQKQVNNSRK